MGAQPPMGTFSYAGAAGAGAGGEGGRQQAAEPLSKEEKKNMLTIIMSAIVYSHYMEALVPGSFQENINDIYRLNGRERSREEAGRQTDEDGSGAHALGEPDLEMDLDDEAIEREEREIDTMIERHRESMTPPNRDDKRKKNEEQSKQTQQSRQDLPQQEKQTVKQTAQAEAGAIPKTQREPRRPRDEEERQRTKRYNTPTPI